ncbi:MAG: ABC transporter permease [Candidatus Faecousia sp.]|nr:ABC transporter permease [Candidatus Faecousia sp.]
MTHSDSRNNASPSRALLGRELRLFAKEVPAALLIAVLLGLFCALAASAMSHGAESGYTPAPVAVVDADGSFASSLGISLIAQQDFAAPLQIEKTDRETAEAGLADGRFSAALYLPTGFADDILAGIDSHVQLVVSENAPLHSEVIQLLCDFGQELLRTGQYGVFAGERLVLDAAPELHSRYLKKSNTLFLTKALSDPGIQQLSVGYAQTGLAAEQWYLALYTMTFFLLLSLGCGFLSRDLQPALLRRLASCGVTDRALLSSRLIVVFFFYLAAALLFLTLAGLNVSILGLASLLLALLTLALVGMALTICLPRDQSVVALTILAALGLLASGGVLPRMELPRLVTQMGDLLPTGAAARLCAPLFGGRSSPIHLGMCLFWGLLSWLAMALRLGRLRKGGGE